MLLQVVCKAHSPVCSTLRIAQKKEVPYSFFFGMVRLGGGGSMFQEVGVCMGFQRGVG